TTAWHKTRGCCQRCRCVRPIPRRAGQEEFGQLREGDRGHVSGRPGNANASRTTEAAPGPYPGLVCKSPAGLRGGTFRKCGASVADGYRGRECTRVCLG